MLLVATANPIRHVYITLHNYYISPFPSKSNGGVTEK